MGFRVLGGRARGPRHVDGRVVQRVRVHGKQAVGEGERLEGQDAPQDLVRSSTEVGPDPAEDSPGPKTKLH